MSQVVRDYCFKIHIGLKHNGMDHVEISCVYKPSKNLVGQLPPN
jgi:hypothetical protein